MKAKENFRNWQDSDIKLFENTFNKYVEGFDCHSWSHGKYTNNYFRNCANQAFKDFLEFFKGCWGMSLKTFKDTYLKNENADVKIIGPKYHSTDGVLQQIRYKTVGCYFTIIPVNITGKKSEDLIFPNGIINVWDPDRTMNVPIFGETHESLVPSPGIFLTPEKEQRTPTRQNVVTVEN